MEITDKQVINFISRFTSRGRTTEVISCFTNGCCYWFAKILYERFIDFDAEIMYDETINHFATLINGKVYDITGDVTTAYRWVLWSSICDELLKERIIRDCINF